MGPHCSICACLLPKKRSGIDYTPNGVVEAMAKSMYASYYQERQEECKKVHDAGMMKYVQCYQANETKARRVTDRLKNDINENSGISKLLQAALMLVTALTVVTLCSTGLTTLPKIPIQAYMTNTTTEIDNALTYRDVGGILSAIKFCLISLIVIGSVVLFIAVGYIFSPHSRNMRWSSGPQRYEELATDIENCGEDEEDRFQPLYTMPVRDSTDSCYYPPYEVTPHVYPYYNDHKRY